MHHYTYVIHNDLDGRYYIGVRSSRCDPHDDPYMGSCSDAVLRAEMWAGYPWSKYISGEFATREEANADEVTQLTTHIKNGLCVNKICWTNKLLSPVALEKISAKLRGRSPPPFTEEHRKNIGLASRRPMSEETKRKLSDYWTGRKRQLGPKPQKANPQKAKPPKKTAAEISAAISAAKKGKKRAPFTPEHRAAMRAAWERRRRASANK